MLQENAYASIQDGWRQLDLLDAGAVALLHLKPLRAQFATQPVRLLLSAVRQRHGVSAGISELRVQPFRGKTRKAKPAPQPPATFPAVSAISRP